MAPKGRRSRADSSKRAPSPLPHETFRIIRERSRSPAREQRDVAIHAAQNGGTQASVTAGNPPAAQQQICTPKVMPEPTSVSESASASEPATQTSDMHASSVTQSPPPVAPKETAFPRTPNAAFLCVDGKIRALVDNAEIDGEWRQPVILSTMPSYRMVLYQFEPNTALASDIGTQPKLGEFQVMVIRDHSPTLGWGAVFPMVTPKRYEKIAAALQKHAARFVFSDTLQTMTIAVEIKGEASTAAAVPLETVELVLPRVDAAYAASQGQVSNAAKCGHMSDQDTFAKRYQEWQRECDAAFADRHTKLVDGKLTDSDDSSGALIAKILIAALARDKSDSAATSKPDGKDGPKTVSLGDFMAMLRKDK